MIAFLHTISTTSGPPSNLTNSTQATTPDSRTTVITTTNPTSGTIIHNLHPVLWAIVTVVAFRYAVHRIRGRPKKPDLPVRIPPSPFTQELLTEQFISSIPMLTSEANLEVATCKLTEVLEIKEAKSVFWGLLDLGANWAEIRVPVTYRFHIRVYESWRLEIKGHKLVVHAPPLRPSLPPAIHSEALDKRTSRGWLRCSPDNLMEQLIRDLTPNLSRMAEHPDKMHLVHDTCRQSVVALVGRWLAQEKRLEGIRVIEVRFANEIALEARPDRPSLNP